MKIDSEFRYDINFPIKIIYTKGNVKGADALLTEKDLQITTSEDIFTTLKNSICSDPAEILLDFGKEFNGSIRILTYHFSGKTPEIQITYGESVSEAMTETGNNGATNDHALRDFTCHLPSYSDMTFSESGFRFARIKLLTKNAEIKIKSVILVSKIRDIPYLGSFRCSNETINKIFDVSAYTCHLNMQQYIWDGIKRDRLVWVGDMHPEMLTVKSVFGNHPIIKDSLNFMRRQTPLPDWMNGMPTYSLWWLIILYDWYFYSGDREFLSENKEYARDLIRIISNLVNDDATDNLPSYFLDWPCNDRPEAVSGSRALLCLALDSATKLSEIFSDCEMADKCRKKMEILQHTEIKTYGAKQVTAIASLAGCINKKEASEEILRDLSVGWSTFMSYYLLKAASFSDMSSTLSALEEYYGGMLSMGATSFWEDFDIMWLKNASPIDKIPKKGKSDVHADNGRFCYKGLRHSLCHGWSSGPAPFLLEKVLGINVEKEGCKTISIKPDLGNLDFAEGTFPTPHGIISVKCTRVNDRTEITYEAPKDIEIITD